MSTYGYHKIKDAFGNEFYIKDGQISHIEQHLPEHNDQVKVSLINGHHFWVSGIPAKELIYLLIEDK